MDWRSRLLRLLADGTLDPSDAGITRDGMLETLDWLTSEFDLAQELDAATDAKLVERFLEACRSRDPSNE